VQLKINIMKRKQLTFSIALSAVLLTVLSLVSINKADALRETNTKVLIPCSVQVGGTIIQVGDYCENGGNGCSPNPCGD
jgi:hypothetical protein